MSDRTIAVPRKVSETHCIIWLDAEIGKDGECIEFKRTFATSVEPGARIEDSLDACIVAVRENACPFIFVHQPDQALRAIRELPDKRIIFISSGSMGVHIVPQIRAPDGHQQVYSFYIFCAIPANYVGLVLENLGCLQVFNHETDLLIRLMRDISKEIIQNGDGYEYIDSFRDALDCFVRARNLYKTANDHDKLHPPIMSELHDLEGQDGRSGRIGRLQQMLLGPNEDPHRPSIPAQVDDSHRSSSPFQVRESVAEGIDGDEDARAGTEESDEMSPTVMEAPMENDYEHLDEN